MVDLLQARQEAGVLDRIDPVVLGVALDVHLLAGLPVDRRVDQVQDAETKQ